MTIDLTKLDEAIDISIPVRFNGPQPNAYGVEPATSRPCIEGGLVGDTRRGGSCNFEQYTLIPHCNGTHTECVGHVTHERISVRDCLQDVFIRALLVSVIPEKAGETSETYAVEPIAEDRLITQRSLESAIASEPQHSEHAPSMRSVDDGNGETPPAYAGGSDIALVVRTLPNDDSKLARQYGKDNVPAYFTTEAMEFIVRLGVKHFLIDLPSIDRLYDEGKLSNHRIFWNVEQGSFERNAKTRTMSTITELVYVSDAAQDGEYLLNLQIAPFAADASPSRPLLFRNPS